MNNTDKKLEQLKKWHKDVDNEIRKFTDVPDGVDDEVREKLISTAEKLILQSTGMIDFNKIITITFDVKRSSSFNWIEQQVKNKKNPLVSNTDRVAIETAKCVLGDLAQNNIPSLYMNHEEQETSIITISYPLHNLLFEDIEGLNNEWSEAFKLNIKPIIGLKEKMNNHYLGWLVMTTIGGTISPDSWPIKNIVFIDNKTNKQLNGDKD